MSKTETRIVDKQHGHYWREHCLWITHSGMGGSESVWADPVRRQTAGGAPPDQLNLRREQFQIDMWKSCIHACARTVSEYDRSVRKRGGSALNLVSGLETTRKEPQNGASLYDCHLIGGSSKEGEGREGSEDWRKRGTEITACVGTLRKEE